jgi:hypothetical protein
MIHRQVAEVLAGHTLLRQGSQHLLDEDRFPHPPGPEENYRPSDPGLGNKREEKIQVGARAQARGAGFRTGSIPPGVLDPDSALNLVERNAFHAAAGLALHRKLLWLFRIPSACRIRSVV